MMKTIIKHILNFAIFSLFFVTTFNVYSFDLEGIGYGSTMEEAKKEALSDLSSNIKVQVFSRHEQTTYKNNDKVTSDYTKFIKLSSNIPLISPSVYYGRENGKHKARAVIDKPLLYAEKLSDITAKINNMTKDINEKSDKALAYKLLKSTLPLYDEYENYKLIADVIGIKEYSKPKISSSDALKLILEMQENPPSLEVAAEVLTREIDEKNIYVAPVLFAGSENITEFGAFFKDMLSSKVNAVKVEEDGDHKLLCSYSVSGGYIIITCSLTTGVSKVLKSSVTKVASELATMELVPKMATSSILNNFTPPKTDYKIYLKISTDGDPTFLRENEPFSLLVKANKPGYVYFVTINNSEDGASNVLLLDWNNEFIKYIDEKSVNKWVSIGKFRVSAPFGSESLYAFGLEKKPIPEYIIPEYTINKIGNLKNVRPSVFMQDIISLFKRQEGDKTFSHITYTTAPNRKIDNR